MRRRTQGFTLVEMLVVLGIIGVLAALSFAVFSRVREGGRRTACLSNLRQLGAAVALYQQDNDDLFPRGGDPTDIHTAIWHEAANGIYAQEADQLPPLTFVLRPYIKSKQVWHCPSDTGLDVTESGQALKARPSSFDAFAMSYYYRTELTFKRKKELLAWEPQPPHTEHGAEAVNVLFDGHGAWHGGDEEAGRRYNVLWGDGHVKNVDRSAFMRAWRLRLEAPGTAPPAP